MVRITKGKGGKARSQAFGKMCAELIWRYLRTRDPEAGDPLFPSGHTGIISPFTHWARYAGGVGSRPMCPVAALTGSVTRTASA